MNKNRDFMFKRIKKRFVWEDSYFRVIFSKPFIEAHEPNKLLETTDDIRYFYYRVRLQKKSNTKWKTIIDVSPYDFPMILALKNILSLVLDNDMENDCQINRDEEGNIYSKVINYSTDCICYEDFYTLERVKWIDREDKYYFGIGQGVQALDVLTNTYRLPPLNRNEILELKTCVNRFIDYAIDLYNENLHNDFMEQRENKKVSDNILYVNTTDGLECYVLNDYFSEINYWEDGNIIEKHNVTLVDMYGSQLSFEDKQGDIIFIHTEDLYYICQEVSQEHINYNALDIVDDFIEQVLNKSQNLKNLFISEDTNTLVKTYGNLLVNRYWFYREEHKFITDSKKRKEQIESLLFDIIYEIKDKIND